MRNAKARHNARKIMIPLIGEAMAAITPKPLPEWARREFGNWLRSCSAEGILRYANVDTATDAVYSAHVDKVTFEEFESDIMPGIRELCRQHGIR